jgi:hypothetical protein
LPHFAIEKVPSPKIRSNFKTTYHNLKMTISRNPRATAAPQYTSTTSFAPCHEHVPLPITPKQLSNLANNNQTSSIPKNATCIQIPPNFSCTSHQRTPMQIHNTSKLVH